MKVRSPLATFHVRLGTVERRGNSLILHSRHDSALDAEITVSAAEVLQVLGLVLATPAGLLFVIGLPFFWLRERLGRGTDGAPAVPAPHDDINKPW